MVLKELGDPIIREDIERIVSENLPWEKFRDATILVTGASGMIPSYIVYTLLGLNDVLGIGIRVLALVRNGSKAQSIFGDVLSRDDIELVEQDVCEKIDLEKADYIFHGASAARPALHKKAPVSTIKANLLGTMNLLDLAVKCDSEAFVMMSSSEVYGTVSDDIKSISESDYGYLDILDPRSCYSEGKRASETIASCYHAQYGIDVRAVRFAHIYGPGMALDDGRVQADFAANVFRGEDIVMKSDGSSVRAYTYVADAVTGMFYALLKGTDISYNVADMSGTTSIRGLAEAFIASRPDKRLKLVIDIPEDQRGSYNPASFIGLASDKLEALGWTPKVPLAEGCARMISHYENTVSI